MNRGRGPGCSEGFTLVEVMVALLLTSMVALLSHQLLAGVVDAGAALRRTATPAGGAVLAREWALEACHTLEVGTPGSQGFEGTATNARFTARLVTSDGWIERQSVILTAGAEDVAVQTGAIKGFIADSTEQGTLEYLVDGGGEGGWVTGWSSPVSAPLAIRIRWIRAGVAGSLLCPIGARG